MSNYPGALSGGFVSHRFVSLKADQPDLSVVNPTNWNQSHIIGSGALQSGAFGAWAITSGNLSSGSVIPGSASSGAVSSGALGANTVNSGNVNSGSVTYGTLASGVITSGLVASGAVQWVQLLNTSKPFVVVTKSGPSDGGDFGPGTTGTQTGGLVEAWNYVRDTLSGGSVFLKGWNQINVSGQVLFDVKGHQMTLEADAPGNVEINSTVQNFAVAVYDSVGNGQVTVKNLWVHPAGGPYSGVGFAFGLNASGGRMGNGQYSALDTVFVTAPNGVGWTYGSVVYNVAGNTRIDKLLTVCTSGSNSIAFLAAATGSHHVWDIIAQGQASGETLVQLGTSGTVATGFPLVAGLGLNNSFLHLDTENGATGVSLINASANEIFAHQENLINGVDFTSGGTNVVGNSVVVTAIGNVTNKTKNLSNWNYWFNRFANSPQGLGIAQPAVPLTGVTTTNTNPFRVYVYLSVNSGTSIAVNGSTVWPNQGNPYGTVVILEPLDTIAWSNGIAPTWKWYGVTG